MKRLLPVWAALLIAALLLSTYTKSNISKIPLDIDHTVVSDGSGTAFDPASLVLEPVDRPVLHGAFKLSELHQAERYFVNRGSNYLGKIVIVPDAQWDTHGAPFAITTA